MGFEPIGFVLERVYDVLKHEASILKVDEKTEIEGMKWELEEIESYLKDMDEVEQVAKLNNVLETKLKRLGQILPQIEDLVDRVTNQNLQPIKPSFRNKVKAFFSGPIQKHRLVDEIKRIRGELNHIQQAEGYPLPSNHSQVTYRTKRQSDPNILDHEIIIGLDDDVRDLVAKFIRKEGEKVGPDSAILGMGGSSIITTFTSLVYNFFTHFFAYFFGKEAERGSYLEGDCGTILAILGMGGLGKTTLAKKFYNQEEIKKAFPRRAWVCVSQEWNTRKLLLQICENLGLEILKNERSNETIVRDKLTMFLRKEGSCLVVLDDVWKREALQDFLPTLLTGNGGVLITTRKEGIFQFPEIAALLHVHHMRRLTPEQSRELFSKIVCNNGLVSAKFVEEGEGEEDDFAKLGREMLEKCDGLPIAIITLAGALGKKTIIQDWKSFKDKVISKIMKDESNGPLGYEAVKKVFEFSYLDLPYYIKPCFLYLGTFQEDEEIDVDTLINLWIDEGFIKPDQCTEGMRLEEVAVKILEELVQRCMVQTVSRDYARDIRKVRIHDLMRDFCIYNARELGFFRVFSPPTTSPKQIEPCHRVVLHNRQISRDMDRPPFRDDIAKSIVSVSEFNPRMRSLICINVHILGFEKLKLLRVLSLERVKLGDSAEHIGNMVLLKYLRFWECGMTRMDFLKKLRNLQTFIFWSSKVTLLSDDMFGSMEQLKVLSLAPNKSIFVLHESPEIISIGVDKLSKLETLTMHSDKWIVKDLCSAICSDLQQLRIKWIKSQPELDAILCCLNNKTLTRLQTLELWMYSGSLLEFDLEKMNLESNCPLLKTLELHGRIKKQRDGSMWTSFPPNLLSLELWYTKVEEEGDMNQLFAQIPHYLKKLVLDYTYKGANFTMSGLPNLHMLELRSMSGLKEWRMTQGSLPQLRELTMKFCKDLERIPDGIKNVKTLQRLNVEAMSRRFCKRLEKRQEGESEGGEDFHLVQHIPNITFFFW